VRRANREARAAHLEMASRRKRVWLAGNQDERKFQKLVAPLAMPRSMNARPEPALRSYLTIIKEIARWETGGFQCLGFLQTRAAHLLNQLNS
jgi:hypothetical protein